MFLNMTSTALSHCLLMTACLLLSSPLYAENRMSLLPSGDQQIYAENDESGLEQTLDQNFSPEDRARLRKALADYAKNAYPEHTQIENKRKAMQESVQQRFTLCDQDNDESLDREEATQCLPQVARHFNYVDVDENGIITLEELELAQGKSIERQKAAEAKMEAQRLQDAETEIKNKAKAKSTKQMANIRKRPS